MIQGDASAKLLRKALDNGVIVDEKGQTQSRTSDKPRIKRSYPINVRLYLFARKPYHCFTYAKQDCLKPSCQIALLLRL